MSQTARKASYPASVKVVEIVREYGPFAGVDAVHGVTFDGQHIWAATGDNLIVLDPDSGEVVRTVRYPGDAGMAFDGAHLYQITAGHIAKIDIESGEVVATIAAPGEGNASGLAWAEGYLWVGQYQGRKIHKIDPNTGAVLRTLESNRFVTGVTWVDGELWHGTWESDKSDIRRIDSEYGTVLEQIDMPHGVGVSGLEAGDAGVFYCGGGGSGKLRAVRFPKTS